MPGSVGTALSNVNGAILGGGGAMFWVISLAYGIAVMAIASALAFGMIWSVERFAKRRFAATTGGRCP
jgi:hypothetical protein